MNTMPEQTPFAFCQQGEVRIFSRQNSRVVARHHPKHPRMCWWAVSLLEVDLLLEASYGPYSSA
jgi:hypothetical protein